MRPGEHEVTVVPWYTEQSGRERQPDRKPWECKSCPATFRNINAFIIHCEEKHGYRPETDITITGKAAR